MQSNPLPFSIFRPCRFEHWEDIIVRPRGQQESLGGAPARALGSASRVSVCFSWVAAWLSAPFATLPSSAWMRFTLLLSAQ